MASAWDRFWAKVDAAGDCWYWTGAKNMAGYGKFHYGTMQLAHRVVFDLVGWVIPEGYVVDHLCRVHNCVNPMHLEAVTHHENLLRGKNGRLHEARTHCPKGHELTNDNVYVHSTTMVRYCKICHKADITRRYRN